MENEISECVTLLNEVNSKCKEATSFITQLISEVEENTTQGIDLLGVKNAVLSSYLADLCQLIHLKCRGLSIQDCPSLHRLVENRTVIEKVKPIHERLKYQISKLVQAARNQNVDEADPLRLKPRPGDMLSKLGDDENNDEDSDEDSDEEKKERPKVYVAPRLAPVYYDGDLNENTRREVGKEAAKKRALRMEVMRDLQAEYSEAPLEITESVDAHKTKAQRIIHNKKEFEEDRFVRLPKSREEKRSLKMLGSSMNDITHFGSFSALDDNSATTTRHSGERKRKKFASHSKKSSTKKKRRK